MILIQLKSLYELRKRLFLINQALSFFFFFKYSFKLDSLDLFKRKLFLSQGLDFFSNYTELGVDLINSHSLNQFSLNFFSPSSVSSAFSFDSVASSSSSLAPLTPFFRKRLTRDFCLKINHKDIKSFLFRQSSFYAPHTSFHHVTNLNIKKSINFSYLMDLFKKINNSLEKSY